MCGIFGVLSFGFKEIEEIKVNDALAKLSHRGPDFRKVIRVNSNLVIGHARLSIIDLSEDANQPFFRDNLYIVFNGEIYNYLELREELISYGFSFSTNSDTEVLIYSYKHWGEDCVKRFNGMWAFAIYNEDTNVLFCSRDRYGVKPFNYYLSDNEFIFSSEIKSLLQYDPNLRKPNYNSIGLFCREGICGEIEETWFKDILRLSPGHNLVIKNGKIKNYQYYNYPSHILNISFEDAKLKFINLFQNSVKLRMRSDVPVGTTLSGGLDSNSIVSVLRTFFNGEHNTFTAYFPNYKDDETEKALKTNNLLNLKGNLVEANYDENYINTLAIIIYHLESGHLSPAVFPLWEIYKAAKKKVKVVLEGQGADELMAGYIAIFAGEYLLSFVSRLKMLELYKNLKLLHKNYSLKQIFTLFVRNVSPNYIKQLVRKYVLKQENVYIGHLKKVKFPYKFKYKKSSLLNNRLKDSHRNTLVNLLHYGDAISMAHSIESRLPFMDYRLVDFCFSLPDKFLISKGKGKFILREAMKSILPEHLNKDIRKLGFPSPIHEFIINNLESIRCVLLAEKSISRNLFDKINLNRMLEEDFAFKENNERIIYRLLSVELWFRVFIDQKELDLANL